MSSSPGGPGNLLQESKRVSFKRPIPAIILFLLLAASCIAIVASRRATMSRPGLEANESDLSLGDLWETDEHKSTVAIRNTSDQDIEILSFRTSCGCTKVNPPALMIPAGGEGRISLSLNLVGHGLPDDQPEDFLVSLSPVFRQESLQDTTWQISARIRSVLAVDSKELDWGRISTRQQTRTEHTVGVRSSIPLGQLKVQCTSPNITVRSKRTSSDRDYEIEMRPLQCLQVGLHTFPVTLEGISPQGKILGVRSFSAQVCILEDIQASPSMVLFGAQPIGTSVSQTITFCPLSTARYTLAGKTATSGITTVEALSPSDGTQLCFKVNHQIKVLGPINDEIVFEFLDDRGEHTSVRVPVSSYGLGAEAH